MKKLIHVRGHLRKGKIVKAHSRKSTRQKKRNLAYFVSTKGESDVAPAPMALNPKRGKKGMSLKPGGAEIKQGRLAMREAGKTDRLADKPAGTVLAKQKEVNAMKPARKRMDTMNRLVGGYRIGVKSAGGKKGKKASGGKGRKY